MKFIQDLIYHKVSRGYLHKTCGRHVVGKSNKGTCSDTKERNVIYMYMYLIPHEPFLASKVIRKWLQFSCNIFH